MKHIISKSPFINLKQLKKAIADENHVLCQTLLPHCGWMDLTVEQRDKEIVSVLQMTINYYMVDVAEKLVPMLSNTTDLSMNLQRAVEKKHNQFIPLFLPFSNNKKLVDWSCAFCAFDSNLEGLKLIFPKFKGTRQYDPLVHAMRRKSWDCVDFLLGKIDHHASLHTLRLKDGSTDEADDLEERILAYEKTLLEQAIAPALDKASTQKRKL